MQSLHARRVNRWWAPKTMSKHGMRWFPTISTHGAIPFLQPVLLLVLAHLSITIHPSLESLTLPLFIVQVTSLFQYFLGSKKPPPILPFDVARDTEAVDFSAASASASTFMDTDFCAIVLNSYVSLNARKNTGSREALTTEYCPCSCIEKRGKPPKNLSWTPRRWHRNAKGQRWIF